MFRRDRDDDKSARSLSSPNEQDIGLLQRELGVSIVSDADVQAEWESLQTGDLDSGANAESDLENELQMIGVTADEFNNDQVLLDPDELLNMSDNWAEELEHSEEVSEEDLRNADYLNQLLGLDQSISFARIDLLTEQLEAAKKKAIHLKRQGKIREALDIMKGLKNLEKQIKDCEQRQKQCTKVGIEQNVQANTISESNACEARKPNHDEHANDTIDVGKNTTNNKLRRSVALNIEDPASKPEKAPLHVANNTPTERNSKPSSQSLLAKIQIAKQQALQCKRDGDTEKALNIMRQIKILENLQEKKAHESLSRTTASLPHAGKVAPKSIPDGYAELEQKLVQFANEAMLQSKNWLKLNRDCASFWLSKRRYYVAELDKIRGSRKEHPNLEPPKFRIEQQTQSFEKRISDVSPDQLVVLIKSVSKLPQLAGKEVYIQFCLNFPSSSPYQGTTGNFVIPTSTSLCSNIPNCSFSFAIKRSRVMSRLMKHKKAVFEVWRPSSIFRSAELVARGYQSLSPLLGHCEIASAVPFTNENRRPTGGDLEIAIRLHTPLRDKETHSLSYKSLIIVSASSCGVKDTLSAEEQYVDFILPATSKDENDVDPNHLDLIISYDVIDDEISRIQQSAQTDALKDRLGSLTLKKQLLEIQMESGKLTLEDYLGQLIGRIQLDRKLYQSLVSKNRANDAAHVLRRIQIMEKERKMEAD